MAFDAKTYAGLRPDLTSNWNNAQNGDPNDPVVAWIRQFPTFEAYLENDYNSNPQPPAVKAQVESTATQAPSLNTGALTQPTPQIDFTALTNASQQGGSTAADLVKAQVPNVSAPNANPSQQYAQNATGAQQGGYASQGTTSQSALGGSSQQTSQLGGQNVVQNTTGTTAGSTATTGTQATTGTNTQQQAGVSTGSTTGTQQQSGYQGQVQQGTTQVTTPFDIASLISKQLPQTAQADAARTAFLTDFMQTGGTALNSQVDQAVRQSLSGPQQAGTGESAQARAAGYAAAQIGRQNADQRLSAAGQLAGGSGLGSLTQQTAPLFGTSTSNIAGSTFGNTTGTTQNTANTSNMSTVGTNSALTNTAQNTTNQQSTAGTNTTAGTNWNNSATNGLNFQNLVGTEAQGGTAFGNSASSGFGTAPQGQQVNSGGCFVCTAYASMGWVRHSDIRRAVAWKLSQPRYRTSLMGYLLYGPALARLVLSSGWFAHAFFPIARAVLRYELSLADGTSSRRLDRLAHAGFHYGSIPFGWLARAIGRQTTVCPRINSLLDREGLRFAL